MLRVIIEGRKKKRPEGNTVWFCGTATGNVTKILIKPVPLIRFKKGRQPTDFKKIN